MKSTKSAATSNYSGQSRWCNSVYGRQYIVTESTALRSALKNINGPRVLQLGELIDQAAIDQMDLPELIVCSSSPSSRQAQLIADPAFLPLGPESVASVIVPHVLDTHPLPHQVLREAHRVLRAEGCLLLSGFSPYSLIGLQRWLWPRAVVKGQYYSVGRVIDWLQLLGFEVVGSAMFQYAPLTKSKRLQNGLSFVNSIGDRWLPMTGGGYMITARKRELGTTMIGKVKFARQPRKLVNAASVRALPQQAANHIRNYHYG